MMPNDFFGRFGDSVEFLNQKDLETKWREIGTEVPARTRGRKTDHRERFCLNAYLRYALDEGSLVFPFRVRKDEGPDCWINWDGRSLGWEHTDAGSPEFQKWLMEIEASSENVHLLPGDGWAGDLPVKQWSDDIWSAIAAKLKHYGSRPPGGTEGCDLFVYDNTGTKDFMDEGTVTSALADVGRHYRDFVGPNTAKQPFRRVLVQSRPLRQLIAFRRRSVWDFLQYLPVRRLVSPCHTLAHEFQPVRRGGRGGVLRFRVFGSRIHVTVISFRRVQINRRNIPSAAAA